LADSETETPLKFNALVNSPEERILTIAFNLLIEIFDFLLIVLVSTRSLALNHFSS
jgi:hypothetical protein